MIDCEENFLEVKALGEDLAMQVLKLVSTHIYAFSLALRNFRAVD